LFNWWRDVSLESNNIGYHNKYIINITIIRIVIFIISEVFFFVRFFWTFLNSVFSLDIMVGSSWPVTGIIKIDFFRLPLLNSILLLRRGCSITWRHIILINNLLNETNLSLLVTILLGVLFLLCQFVEYKYCYFSISDSIFGSTFFISTGFHGIHVIIGRIFLAFIALRIKFLNFSRKHLTGFEMSIWYWHFVDVVWLYLFILIYWFGS